MNFRTLRAKLWLLCALAAVVTVGGGSNAAHAQQPAYAVLIVGDEGDADMLRTEKILINEMAKQIRSDGDSDALPIYSYHFNKERERAYCENKLNVLAEDLLFVGVVTLVNKVPTKVVYRIDRISNAPRAAKDVLDRADELVAEAKSKATVAPVPPTAPAPATTPSTSSSQTPTATSTPSPPASGTSGASDEAFRVQLGSFASRVNADDCRADAQRAGLEAAIVEAKGPNGDTVYKVLSPVLNGRATADEQLQKFKAAGFEQAFSVRVTK